MGDSKYCYPDSDVLINKLGLTDKDELFLAEMKLTSARLQNLELKTLKGDFDFDHLKAIHKYIFQDVYDWAGKTRTVEIGKGNLFCTVKFIDDYARSVFGKYFPQCYDAKDNFEDFVRSFAENYGDLNALHPFREGNGRAQREFARLVCLECGYDFDLYKSTHKEMLAASKLSFNRGDSSGFVKIFSQALTPLKDAPEMESFHMKILSGDDLISDTPDGYDDYGYGEYKESDAYNKIYEAKIDKMDAEKTISDAKISLSKESKKGSVLKKLSEKKKEAQELNALKPQKNRSRRKQNEI